MPVSPLSTNNLIFPLTFYDPAFTGRDYDTTQAWFSKWHGKGMDRRTTNLLTSLQQLPMTAESMDHTVESSNDINEREEEERRSAREQVSTLSKQNKLFIG